MSRTVKLSRSDAQIPIKGEPVIPVNEPLLYGNERKYLNDRIDTSWISSEEPSIKKSELKVLEDAAQMHSQAHNGRPCGRFGDTSIATHK